MDTCIFGLPRYTDSVFRVKPHLVDIAELFFVVSCIRSSRKRGGSDRFEENS